MKQTLISRLFLLVLLCSVAFAACHKKPSKAELMRQQKQEQDSVQAVQNRRTLAYSDSMLNVLLPKADSLLKDFKYEKAEGYEDHGRYVHRLLTTDRNTARNYLKATVRDDRVTILQSFCFAPKPVRQQRVRVSSGDLFADAEGTNHAFEAEGWHEILTVQDDDAIQLLRFISGRQDERLAVTAEGAQRVKYYLQDNEKKALAETYQLALIMKDIATLERAIHVADLQVQKYEKKKAKQQ